MKATQYQHMLPPADNRQIVLLQRCSMDKADSALTTSQSSSNPWPKRYSWCSWRPAEPEEEGRQPYSGIVPLRDKKTLWGLAKHPSFHLGTLELPEPFPHQLPTALLL